MLVFMVGEILYSDVGGAGDIGVRSVFRKI